MIITLPIQGLWLKMESDPSQSLHFEFVTQVLAQPQTPGEDRMYGNGRYVQLTAGATQRQYAIAAQAIPAQDVATLLAWDSALLYYLDDRNARMFGSYRSPQVTWHQYDADADVSFTFTEKTYSEAV